MPSVSKKQHNLMAAVAKNPAFAKKAGIPQSVGSEFIKADKGKKFVKGGDMKKLPPFMGKETKAEEAKEMKIKAKSPAMYRKGEKAEGVHGKSGMKKPTKYAAGGFTKAADGMAQRGHTKAQKFDMGGAVDPNATAAPLAGRLYQSLPVRAAVPVAAPVAAPVLDRRAQRRAAQAARKAAHDAQRMQRKSMPMTKPTGLPALPGAAVGAMKAGGCVKMARGGGCEVKGKTKGRYI